jgi:hypothetical protein
MLNATDGHRLHPGIFRRNPKMITRWPSHVTVTRRDKIDDLHKPRRQRLNGKLRVTWFLGPVAGDQVADHGLELAFTRSVPLPG